MFKSSSRELEKTVGKEEQDGDGYLVAGMEMMVMRQDWAPLVVRELVTRGCRPEPGSGLGRAEVQDGQEGASAGGT